MCDVQQHFEQTNCKTITALNEEWDKLYITANTSHIRKCLFQYPSQYIPAERRHRNRSCPRRISRDKILQSQSELFRQKCGMWSQLLHWVR